jgi:hypothetical protein
MPRHEVTLADCAVAVDTDPALPQVHERVVALFDTSVARAPVREAVVAVRRADDGTVVVASPAGEVRCRDLDDALDQVLAAVNAAVLPPSTLLTLHAGAVLTARGVVAWPGLSGAGKSTLAAAAVAHGLPLVSDESLCLDPATADVVPYPKPVSLSAAMASRLALPAGDGEASYSAAGLGGTATGRPARLGAVVLLERRPGDPALHRTGSDRAAAALLRHSFNHFRMPLAAVTVVHEALADAEAVTLGYDDPAAAARLLAEAFGTP